VDALAAALIHWLENEADRRQAGDAGRQLVVDNRGALERLLGLLAPLLEKAP